MRPKRISPTNEHLPADTQQRHARLIAMAPVLLDVLLDIKCMAGKHSDAGYCPYTQLELIEDTAVCTLADAMIGASP